MPTKSLRNFATELSFANEELKKLDAAKSEFISIAGHQLRTPLTVIKGYTSMVLEGSFGKIPESIKEALNRVLISSGALAKLVSDLLDLSRIESGKIRYEFKEIDMEAIVRGVMQELEETARAKGIMLELRNENIKDAKLVGDFDKLHEVIINLMDNAIKYSSKGSVTISLKKRLAGDASHIVVSVSDQGMGIKPEDIPKMFVKFGRTEEAKKVIEDHKGRVSVESPGPGQGSTFFIELPTSRN
ncbi:MAG: PAS/PAC sensor signal transduction histidine kinase [Parcubacteria group bacterium GW2011_GWA1_51_12]|nr:MAG: PAS/PAC sensor signal transduction histidine kinase [Parcubacteria group bacterium GW2011_GWA1_51_12]